eukprot:TRINITY_DN59_c0_g1_i7.p1 TRINITY_DN59_c0_g1~~TRINITY_DN59_c0_g1_i7.p1  ORF type:complete len:487 (+),score=94.00 TRINITY_DN59_c0_g1_i7:90-1463(+)
MFSRSGLSAGRRSLPQVNSRFTTSPFGASRSARTLVTTPLRNNATRRTNALTRNTVVKKRNMYTNAEIKEDMKDKLPIWPVVTAVAVIVFAQQRRIMIEQFAELEKNAPSCPERSGESSPVAAKKEETKARKAPVYTPEWLSKLLDEEQIASDIALAKETPIESSNLVYKSLPLRALSRVWGSVNGLQIPVVGRQWVYKGYAKVFGCNLDEVELPLESYPSLADFFTRRLKAGVRPISPADVVSPADARVLVVGEVDRSNGLVEQVKGRSYSINNFLGPKYDATTASSSEGKKLFHIVLYLAPGDYHGFHSPADWKMDTRRHFPGYLLSVNPVVARHVNSLFAVNERVVLLGQWEHGFFSFSPVGATNVGSISVDVEPELTTNQKDQRATTPYSERVYGSNDGGVEETRLARKKGDDMGFFHFGSTVVLVFEAPENFQFKVGAGDKVAVGQTIGELL